MLVRDPEPELMDEPDQARAYAAADFEGPNSHFVDLYAHYIGDSAGPVLDLGCGPGDIPLRLARRYPALRVDALDGAESMLILARQALEREPDLASRVRFINGRIPDSELPHPVYDAVISNSLLHHLHEPDGLWRMICRVTRPGSGVLIMDLFRPADRESAAAIVDTYGAGEPDVLRRDFHHSLLAAFTPEEVRDQLRQAGLTGLRVDTISDRHLLVHGTT